MQETFNFAGDYVFLLEFMINTVNFEKNDLHGTKTVHLQFFGNPPIIINERQFLNVNPEDLNDNISSDKSCLFALTQDQLERAAYSFDVFVKLQAKNKFTQKVEKIGSTIICVCKIFNDIVHRTKRNRSHATSKKLKDEYKLYSLRGHELGLISVYIRMYCFSKTLFTRFPFKLEHNSWYMSNDSSQMSRMVDEKHSNKPERTETQEISSKEIFCELQNTNKCREISKENSRNLRLFAAKMKNNVHIDRTTDVPIKNNGAIGDALRKVCNCWKPDSMKHPINVTNVTEPKKRKVSFYENKRADSKKLNRNFVLAVKEDQNNLTEYWRNPFANENYASSHLLNTVRSNLQVITAKQKRYLANMSKKPAYGYRSEIPTPKGNKTETKTIVTKRFTMSISAPSKNTQKPSNYPKPILVTGNGTASTTTTNNNNRLRSGGCNIPPQNQSGCCSSRGAPKEQPLAPTARLALADLYNSCCNADLGSSGASSTGTSSSSYMPCTCNLPPPSCYEPIHVTMGDNEYDLKLRVPCETELPESGEIAKKPLERNVKPFAYILNDNGPILVPQCYQTPNGTVKTHFASNNPQLPYDFVLRRRSEGTDPCVHDVDVGFTSPLLPLPTLYSEGECQFVEMESADSGPPFGAMALPEGPFGAKGRYTKAGWKPGEGSKIEAKSGKAGGKKGGKKGKGGKGGKGGKAKGKKKK